jgi:predicted membrane GTPase involved in stress response
VLVQGRGELQLAVVVELMRRAGRDPAQARSGSRSTRARTKTRLSSSVLHSVSHCGCG